MSASRLHARKKYHPLEEEALAMPLSSSSLSSSSRHRARRKKGARSTTATAAFSVAGGFLLVAFVVVIIVLRNTHHHHARRAVVHWMRNPWAHGGALFRRKSRDGFHHHFYSGAPRFVTVVMPSVVNPDARRDRLEAVHQTWGPQARAIYVVHNQTAEFPQGSHLTLSEDSVPYDPYSYPQTLLLPPDIGIEDGVPRLFHTIRSIHEKVDPDFCFFVNDHTFVIPEHLCRYLDDQDPSRDLYAGHALKDGGTDVFNSGAAGYILSRATMKKIIDKWNAKDKDCFVGPDASKWLQGNPGLVTVKCLNSLGIFAFDSRVGHKLHRFHAFPITRTVSGEVDQWYINKHEGMSKFDGYDETYNTLLPGHDCCAMETVSFHYVEAMEAKALFSIREKLVEEPHMADTELQRLLNDEWPKGRAERGFYSRDLPANAQKLKTLMSVIRKISRPLPPAVSQTLDC